MTFLPSVMHPSLLSDYVDPFDREMEVQWRRLTGLSEADPRYRTLLARCTLPTNKGGSGIPNTADVASHAQVASVTAVAPMLAQYSLGAYQHMLSTFNSTDPLGVSVTFWWRESTHDAVARSPAAGTEDGKDTYHVPPTVNLATMAELIAAKQSYTDYTLPKNEHKLAHIRLEATYAASLELYAEDWAQLVS